LPTFDAPAPAPATKFGSGESRLESVQLSEAQSSPLARGPHESSELDLLRELRAKLRMVEEVGWVRAEEAHRAGFGAEPDFLGASVEVKRHFLLHLRFGVPRRKHLHANSRGSRKTDAVSQLPHAFRRRPSHIGRFDSVGRRDGTFCESSASWHELS